MGGMTGRRFVVVALRGSEGPLRGILVLKPESEVVQVAEDSTTPQDVTSAT